MNDGCLVCEKKYRGYHLIRPSLPVMGLAAFSWVRRQGHDIELGIPHIKRCANVPTARVENQQGLAEHGALQYRTTIRRDGQKKSDESTTCGSATPERSATPNKP